MSKIRLGLALIILAISLTLLIWGLWPAAQERHTLTVPPSELTLPTPSSYVPDLPAVCAEPVEFYG